MVRIRGQADQVQIERWLSNGNSDFTLGDATVFPNLDWRENSNHWLSGDTDGDGFTDFLNIRKTSTGSYSAPGVPSLTRIEAFTYDPLTALGTSATADAETSFALTMD